MTISTRLQGYLQLTRLTIMPMALGLSALLFISYLIYHAQVGSVPYHARRLYANAVFRHADSAQRAGGGDGAIHSACGPACAQREI